MTIVERVYWDIPKVWCYDPDTFEFTMELDCDPHPAFPGQYLKPDYYLLIPPPSVQEYQTCIAQNGEWVVTFDYKNIPVYDKTTKEKIVITSTGIACPETHTPIKPFLNMSYVVWENNQWIEDVSLKLAYNKQLKKEELRTYFHARFELPFHSPSLNANVQCRRSGANNDLQNYERLLSYMIDNNITTTYIRLLDDSFTGPVTQDQLKILISELTGMALSKFSLRWYMEEMIDDCTNQEELDSINTNIFV